MLALMPCSFEKLHCKARGALEVAVATQHVRRTQHLLSADGAPVSGSFPLRVCAIVQVPSTLARAGTKQQPTAGGPAKGHCGVRLCRLVAACIGTRGP